MRSIRNRILISVGLAIALVYLLMFMIGTYYVRDVIERDSNIMIDAVLNEKTSTLDVYFNSTEKAVEVVSEYVTDNLDYDKLKSDHEYYDNFMSIMTKRLKASAKGAVNVVSAYFRPDPNVFDSTDGIFLTANGYGDYISIPPTDIMKFNSEDTEHVGWYFDPLNSGKFIWMDPYVNKNLNMYMVSYTGPLYVDMQYVGVIGMDVNMSYITEATENVTFRDAFGFIVNRFGDILYHKDFHYGLNTDQFGEDIQEASKYFTPYAVRRGDTGTYSWRGEKHRIEGREMQNGMIYVLSVPESSIVEPEVSMWQNMLFAFVIVLTITVIVMYIFIIHLVRPIKEITAASDRISKGEMNVTIRYHGRDELGLLADSVRGMAKELREYITYIHTQAFVDGMTGVGNKSAYMDQMALISRKIQEGMADFAVVVFDVNGLKHVNDNYGHEVGDMLIMDAANSIREAFGADSTYRIGGDEFIVVLDDVDEKMMKAYFERFDKIIADFNAENERYETKLAISKGAAYFDETQDKEYKEVFKRADEAMYRDKEKYYSGSNDRRRR